MHQNRVVAAGRILEFLFFSIYIEADSLEMVFSVAQVNEIVMDDVKIQEVATVTI